MPPRFKITPECQGIDQREEDDQAVVVPRSTGVPPDEEWARQQCQCGEETSKTVTQPDAGDEEYREDTSDRCCDRRQTDGQKRRQTDAQTRGNQPYQQGRFRAPVISGSVKVRD